MQRWVKYTAQGLENISRHDITVGAQLVLEEMEQPPLVVAPGGKISSPGKIPNHPRCMKTLNVRVFMNSINGQGPPFPTRWILQLPRQSNCLPMPNELEVLPSISILPNPVPGKVPEKELSQYFPGTQVDYSPADQALNAASIGAGVPLTTLLFLMLAVMMFWEGWIVRKE